MSVIQRAIKTMTKSHFIAEIYLQSVKDRMRNNYVLNDDWRRILSNAARDEADKAEQHIQFDRE